ncbi:cutinase family protein [Mycetocola tolaasinivorans]|uniref:Cutinase family protein n=1 Tax=Mycetocola tolaasinivorans TaxID=76635 RepID=A0A3L7AA48_9MICO|nr:cutinase family protein [Mycetocola tolaasinivorans]RLP76935.1 cutinase family protein [Mycetocola tolaasinivorans]
MRLATVAVVLFGALNLPAIFAPVAAAAVPVSAYTLRPTEACTPVAILAFRGSGEENVVPGTTTLAGASTRYPGTDVETNGWEGPTLARLVDAFGRSPRSGSWPAGFSVADVPVLGVGGTETEGYTAVPIEARPSIFGDMMTSATHGAHYAQKVIDAFAATQPEGCHTRYIAVGYSQGAMAARTLAQTMPGLVSAVMTFGDPYQQPGAAGNERQTTGQGIIRWWMGENTRADVDTFYDFAGYKSALCHIGDPVCSYSWLFGLGALMAAPEPHLNYLEGEEGSVKGQELAGLAAKLWGEAQRPGPNPAATPSLASAAAGVAGVPMLFGANAGVPGDLVHYEYNVDGDGFFDAADSGPGLVLTFTEPGDHTVSVRMTGHGIGQIILSKTVRIFAQNDAAPTLPTQNDQIRGCRGDPVAESAGAAPLIIDDRHPETRGDAC